VCGMRRGVGQAWEWGLRSVQSLASKTEGEVSLWCSVLNVEVLVSVGRECKGDDVCWLDCSWLLLMVGNRETLGEAGTGRVASSE